jgi:hypothetical protein
VAAMNQISLKQESMVNDYGCGKEYGNDHLQLMKKIIQKFMRIKNI